MSDPLNTWTTIDKEMTFDQTLILVPCHSLEDFPTELSEAPAESLLNAFAVAWHPLVLAQTGAMPKWRRADEFSAPESKRLIIVPQPAEDWVSHSTLDTLAGADCVVIKGKTRREDYLEAVLAPFGEMPPELAEDPDLVGDFLALGTAWLMSELLTRHMRNISNIDHVRLESEGVAAAKSAMAGDREAAVAHLRRAFETLLECRERFYPVDCYLLDLCLVSPKQADASLDRLLGESAPLSLLITGEDLASVAVERPETVDLLRTAIMEQRVGLVGGDWRETGGTLMSLQHSIWNLYRGRGEFARLVGATPLVWGRRRYGVSPQIPQLVLRSGMSAALHFVIDDGQYPDEEHMKFRWQGCDGSVVDALSRIPLAGDSASSFLRFPQRMAESMDHDHAAGIVFARWPDLRTPFLNDLRRTHRYSPVVGRFATLESFLSRSDVAGRLSDFKAKDYFSPLLVQAVARQQPNPISRHVREWTRRHRFESLTWSSEIATLLGKCPADPSKAATVRDRMESADPEAETPAHEEASRVLDEFASEVVPRLRDAIVPGGSGNSGWLIINPLAFRRKAVVRVPAEEGRPSPGGNVASVQDRNDHFTALVDLPPCGFAWVPNAREASTASPRKKSLAAESFLLRNELFEVLLSDITGGISQIRTRRRSPNRISQQLAFRFPRERTITSGEGPQAESYKSYYSEMRLSEANILCDGPAVGEIETIGSIVDQQQDKELASYRQVTRVRQGRPFVEIEIELRPNVEPEGDPWSNYFGVRWAWKHESVAVSRSCMQGTQPVGDEPRIEAPHFVEIADDDFRTTILPHGMSFHRSTGPRMLDTLLIVAGETRRNFRFDIAIDEMYPMQAALDVMSPPLVVPTAGASAAPEAWLLHLGARNVILLGLSPIESPVDGQPPERNGVVARLLETEGRHRTFGLKCFRTPTAARQRDFNGKTIQECHIAGDEVTVEIAPYEVCEIELTF
jgi:alpha-mannosidase